MTMTEERPKPRERQIVPIGYVAARYTGPDGVTVEKSLPVETLNDWANRMKDQLGWNT